MSLRRPACLLVLTLVTAAPAGCGPPLLFQVETAIHPDGSCDRTIWQPEAEMRPPEALTAAGRAHWKSIKPVPLPPAFALEFQPSNERKYFTATGTFASPAAIPAHYRLVAPGHETLGSSELTRSYQREDFGFVVEHRWTETLTNIVTPAGFLKARDEFLDLAIPALVRGIEEVYGTDFDVTRITKYVREEGRRFLVEAAEVYYDVSSRHLKAEEQALAFAELARRFGLDLFDEADGLVKDEERERRFVTFARHRIALGVRHRDGRRLKEEEIQTIIKPEGRTVYTERWEAYGQRMEKEYKSKLEPPLLRMFGLYNHPLLIFAPPSPRFAFSLRLPGEIVETNGALAGDAASWTFDGTQSFPDGFVMRARSFEVDRALQERALGKVVIDGPARADAYLDIVRQSDGLRQAMRGVRRSNSVQVIRDFKPGSKEEADLAARLRELLRLSP